MCLYGNPLGQDVQRIVLTVCGRREEQLDPGGTCFFIAPAVAITAKHVIQEIQDKFELMPLHNGANTVGYAIHVCGQGELTDVVFEVETVFPCPTSDMAFLLLRALTQEAHNYQHQLINPVLNFTPPAITSEVFAFGYARQSAEDDGQKLLWSSTAICSPGIVREYFPSKRDSLLINFPAFQTNADFIGHMSGSPVANAAGEIVGVVSLSIESHETDVEPVSYAATLLPLLNTPMRMPRAGRSDHEYTYLFEIYRDHYLDGMNWNQPFFDPGSNSS